MEKFKRVWPFVSLILLLLMHEWIVEVKATGVCHSVVSCMKCDGNNQTQCSKCSQLVLRSRSCGESTNSVCPPGYVSKWSSLVDFMSSVCQADRLRSKSLPGELVGGSIGVALCVLSALAAGLYCKFSRKKSSAHRHHSPPSLSHSTQGSDSSEREAALEFMKEVRQLRSEAPLFLEMLNETRRQVRGLPSYSALQPYRPVLKDLSRILILLNRPDSKLGVPPSDWETLFAWAHRILNRYKKHHLSSNNQVNELVNFFQGDASGHYSGASSAFDSNYNSTPIKRRSSETTDEYIEWQRAAQLEDFVSLGFRPQDEITTEL